MEKFKKMVAIEPTKMLPEWDEQLKHYAEEAVFYGDIPQSNEEIIRRIGDADCVMLSFTSRIDAEVLAACKQIRYIGMCCSLYSPESANVDILTANKMGISVTGVRDYGDEGVAEYAVSELVRLLHGRGEAMWREEPTELTGIDVGIVGMGTVGSIVAAALAYFGANIRYYSRTRKPALEQEKGYAYLPLEELLPASDILITCLNKNVFLIGERELALFGDGKIFMNVSIGPAHDGPALAAWLQRPGNYALADTPAAMGEEAAAQPRAIYGARPSGLTSLAKQRLAQKVIANIEGYLGGR